MSLVISIEGNIGSGKSTLVEYLKSNHSNKDIIFLEEPVKEWEKVKDKDGKNILIKFYENQEKYSYLFQMMAYISRLNLLRESIKNNPNSIIITERSLMTDKYVFAKMLHDSDKMEDVEYIIYNKWFNSMIDLAPLNKIIYMKTLPEISFQRIKKRNREGEDNINFSYIEKCNLYHNDMINIIKKEYNIECMELNCNQNLEEDIGLLEKWSKDIMNFIIKV